ncbi:MAG: YgiQ family radical SAM protein [Clostridiaceae bacterium]|nr:YgiQ family radical SAM protein [Clostridiaceae bacterium]
MFLPVSKKDIKERGWDYYDFLFITGDAYIDHPSFGVAILSRLLEKEGYRVAILAQPPWQDTKAFEDFGRPRLGVLISGGVIDSMVNHYTASKKRRTGDVYSPGGKDNLRPDRCVIVYSNKVREAFGDIPIIIGGIEASLRRFAHYDYWQDKVRRSILFDSRADLISYGMGEHQTIEIAKALNDGVNIKDITWIKGTCYKAGEIPEGAIEIPSYEEVRDDKYKYAQSAKITYEEQDPIRGHIIAQKHGDKYLIQNPPAMPLTTEEMDKVYSLPYERTYHPMYEKDGGVKAIEEVKYSITSSRGCFGACSFCALTFHQGRIVQSRSHKSILAEAQKLIWEPDFKGYIHDVGGPTANFRAPSCKKQLEFGTCKNRECLYPAPCRNLDVSHRDYLELLRKLRDLPNVKKVFIRSGIRYDYLLYDKDEEFFYELCQHHVSGQLKVAPEHISDNVLKYMGKPKVEVYDKFKDKFKKINEKIKKEQYLVPYLMSSHPGSTLNDAIELALYLKKNNIRPEQVQDFYPTPGTLSTAMFYTGIDPRTMQKVYVPKSYKEKQMQRALLQYYDPKNYDLIYEALIRAGRTDLIGYSKDSLIKPRQGRSKTHDIGRKGVVKKDKGQPKGRSGKTKGRRR